MEVGEKGLLGVVKGGVNLIFVREGVSGTHGGPRGMVPD